MEATPGRFYTSSLSVCLHQGFMPSTLALFLCRRGSASTVGPGGARTPRVGGDSWFWSSRASTHIHAKGSPHRESVCRDEGSGKMLRGLRPRPRTSLRDFHSDSFIRCFMTRRPKPLIACLPLLGRLNNPQFFFAQTLQPLIACTS